VHEWLLALLMRIDVFLSHWLRAAGNGGCGSMSQLGKLAAHREALLQVFFVKCFFFIWRHVTAGPAGSAPRGPAASFFFMFFFLIWRRVTPGTLAAHREALLQVLRLLALLVQKYKY
jgi:hypothetical protein